MSPLLWAEVASLGERENVPREDQGGKAQPRRRPQGRMPRQPGGRANVVGVRLTDNEKARLDARATSLGVSVQRLMIESALSGSAQTMTDRRALMTELLGVRRLVAAVSNNINQLARVANARGRIPPELATAATAASRILARLEAAIADLSGRQS